MMLLEHLEHLVLTYHGFQLLGVVAVGYAYQYAVSHELQSEHLEAACGRGQGAEEPVGGVIESVVGGVDGTYAAQQTCSILAARA